MKIRVKVVPNARQSEFCGWEALPENQGEVLRVRLAARPIEGQANKELIRFFAKELGIAKSKVQLLQGEKGRIKLLKIPEQAARQIPR